MLRIEVNLTDVKVALEKFREDPVGALDGLVAGWRKQFGEGLTQLMNAEIELFLGQEKEAGNENIGRSNRVVVSDNRAAWPRRCRPEHSD